MKGILDRYGGIIVHSSYLNFENIKHGVCNAHSMRELKFIEDRIQANMKRLLKVAVKMVKR